MKKILTLIILLIILIPNIASATNRTSSTWSEEEIQELIKKEIKDITKFDELKNELTEEKDAFIEELDNKLNTQQNNFLEIIGLFSAVIALIIINVIIVKSNENFFKSICLIIGLTCAMIMFSNLIHIFFAKKIITMLLFIISGILLLIMLILGFIFERKK